MEVEFDLSVSVPLRSDTIGVEKVVIQPSVSLPNQKKARYTAHTQPAKQRLFGSLRYCCETLMSHPQRLAC